MNEEELFVFNRTGDKYLVLEEGELKDPTTRSWLKCVIYKSVKTGNVYSREKEDFLKKFTKVNNNNA